MTEKTNNFSTFRMRDKSHLECKMFLDESGSVDIARFETTKYPIFQKQCELMDSYIWKPTEINLTNDKIDYNSKLEFHEKHIFTSNLKRQILLDSFAGRGLERALGPLVSDPMIESCIKTISYFENRIHSLAYTHIIRNVFTNPSEVFDDMKNIKEIVECGSDVGKYCDDLIDYAERYKHGLVNNQYELKKKLYLYLVSLNAMEGIRFYVSFACSFAFGQSKRMMGNASEIQLIANDEALHVAFTTALLRMLPEDDPDFVSIIAACKEEAIRIYLEVVAQEKAWVKYLLQYGSMLGINEQILYSYLDWLTAKRMRAIHLEYPYESPRHNPLEWMNPWLNEGDVQVAPQETEITSYIRGLEADTTNETFIGFEL